MLKVTKRSDSDVWQIKGTVGSRRVRQSARTTDRAQAEEIAAALESRLRREHHYGAENETTFAEAALRYAEAKRDRGENPCSQYLDARCQQLEYQRRAILDLRPSTSIALLISS